MGTLRTVLSVACRNGWHIHQMDVDAAFLNGNVNGEIYVGQPKGYDKGDGKVYRLKKALYGLRGSSRAWYDCFHDFMISLNFRRSNYDCCLYTKLDNEVLVGLIVYVDDLLVFSELESEVIATKEKMKERFHMKDLGSISNYLGIAVSYDRKARKMEFDQIEYIESLVEKFGVNEMRKYNSPMEKNLKLPFFTDSEPVPDYRKLIGALLYVSTCTRPDVSFATNYLSRFQTCATDNHFRYALRVLKYLQVTKHLKMNFVANSDEILEGWADADWAADTIDRKSTGGTLIRVFGNPVVWTSRKQNSVARASTYAEFIALADTVTEVFPIKGILESLHVSIGKPVPIYEDNTGALTLAIKGKFSKQAKHIEVAYCFVSDYVSKGVIKVYKVDSKDQLADILTKSLGVGDFEGMRSALSVY